MPCIAAYRTANRTPGQRRRAFSSTSRSAAEALAGDQPDGAGQERQRTLELARRTGPRRRAACRSRSRRASSSPSPTSRISRDRRERRAPRWGRTTAWPGRRSGRPRPAASAARRARPRGQVTGTETSASLSRRVRKTVLHAAAPADLGDLPLDPHRAEPVDPGADRLGDLAHRRRMLGRGLQRHVEDPRGPPPTIRVMTDLGTPTVLSPDAAEPRRAAGGAPRLLRGRRPGRDHRGEGARPVRRPGLRAQADRAQQARRARTSSRAVPSSSRSSTRCPRARPSSSPPTASRRWSTTRPRRAA